MLLRPICVHPSHLWLVPVPFSSVPRKSSKTYKRLRPTSPPSGVAGGACSPLCILHPSIFILHVQNSPLEPMATFQSTRFFCKSRIALIDVIDPAEVRVTIGMFNGNACPHTLSEKVPEIRDSVMRAGSDDRGRSGSTIPRFTRFVLAICSWNQGSICSFRRLEAGGV